MNWQPGDLALCIKQGAWRTVWGTGSSDKGTGPPCGAILLVSSVGTGCEGGVTLHFQNWRKRTEPWFRGYNASRFVKITPGTEPQGIEEPRRVPVKEKADA